MRLSKADLAPYQTNDKTKSSLGKEAIAFLGEHDIVASLNAATLGQTILDLHHLISLADKIVEITGYVYAIQRIQVIRAVIKGLKLPFPTKRGQSLSPENQLNLDDALTKVLPLPFETQETHVFDDTSWRLDDGQEVHIEGTALTEFYQAAQAMMGGVAHFVGAAFFLKAAVSKLPPYLFIDGARPSRGETKRNRQYINMTDLANMEWLLSRLSRPLQERGEVAYQYAQSSFKYLMTEYRLDHIKDVLLDWSKSGKEFHIQGIKKRFDISYRKYATLEKRMLAEGLLSYDEVQVIKNKLPTFSLNPALMKKVEHLAKVTGSTPHQVINQIVQDHFERSFASSVLYQAYQNKQQGGRS